MTAEFSGEPNNAQGENIGMVIEHREYAHPFDFRVEGPENWSGMCASSEAIGGFEGKAWTRYYRERVTATLYLVDCWYTANSSKGPLDPYYNWIDRSFRKLYNRAPSNDGTIHISPNEFALMWHCVFLLDEAQQDRAWKPLFHPWHPFNVVHIIGRNKGVPVCVSENYPTLIGEPVRWENVNYYIPFSTMIGES
jgi:hypothetical protein